MQKSLCRGSIPVPPAAEAAILPVDHKADLVSRALQLNFLANEKAKPGTEEPSSVRPHQDLTQTAAGKVQKKIYLCGRNVCPSPCKADALLLS